MELGVFGLSMESFGCVVADCAMMLSYYFGREVLPSELLNWLNAHEGFTSDGRIYWGKITAFTGGKLRYSPTQDTKEGELTYGFRQVYFGRYNHWVIDHPQLANFVLDPWTGNMMAYTAWKYTGQERFFMGKPIEQKKYPVDERYGRKRNLVSEQWFMWNWVPGSAAQHIYRKIGRRPNDRELKALAYGAHTFENVFENNIGDRWLHERKSAI